MYDMILAVAAFFTLIYIAAMANLLQTA